MVVFQIFLFVYLGVMRWSTRLTYVIFLDGGWPTPLKNMSQLGSWNSRYMEKTCSKPPTSFYGKHGQSEIPCKKILAGERT